MTLRNTTVVVCEDIRIEGNGKHILIGVYPTDMIVGQFPASLRLAFWIRIYPPPPPGDHAFRAIIRVPGGGEGAIDGSVAVAGNIPDKVPVVLALTAVPVELSETGEMEVLVGFDGKAPDVVGSMPIRSR